MVCSGGPVGVFMACAKESLTACEEFEMGIEVQSISTVLVPGSMEMRMSAFLVVRVYADGRALIKA